jgi:hypothetical protein
MTLRSLNCVVDVAETGCEALAILPCTGADAALIDDQLPDMAASDLPEQMQRCRPDLLCFVMLGAAAVDGAARTACDPLSAPGLDDAAIAPLRHVTGLAPERDAMARHKPASSEIARPTPLDQWLAAAVKAIGEPRDPRMLKDWARCAGTTTPKLRACCRAAGLPPRRALLFARVLRVIARQHMTGGDPADLFDIVDRRTLAKLLVLSGGDGTRLPPSVDDFLARQRLIDSPGAMAYIRAALGGGERVHDGSLE